MKQTFYDALFLIGVATMTAVLSFHLLTGLVNREEAIQPDACLPVLLDPPVLK